MGNWEIVSPHLHLQDFGNHMLHNSNEEKDQYICLQLLLVVPNP